MGRRILSILTGLGIGLLVIVIIRMMIRTMFPASEVLESGVEDLDTYYSSLPERAYLLLGLSHIFAAFLASLITSLISNNNRFSNGVITGTIVFVVITVFNFTFDYPSLFLMLDTLFSAVAAFAGASFGQGRKV